MAPISRGTVSLASSDPQADPVIDPNYFSTEWDRTIQREAMRFSVKMMGTSAAKGEARGQYQASGMPIGLNSRNEEPDKRMRSRAMSCYYPGATAAPDAIDDSNLRANGVSGLRKMDAGVLPKPVGAHYPGERLFLLRVVLGVSPADY